MMPERLEPAAPRSQVKHSTTEPLHSLLYRFYVKLSLLPSQLEPLVLPGTTVVQHSSQTISLPSCKINWFRPKGQVRSLQHATKFIATNPRCWPPKADNNEGWLLLRLEVLFCPIQSQYECQIFILSSSSGIYTESIPSKQIPFST